MFSIHKNVASVDTEFRLNIDEIHNHIKSSQKLELATDAARATIDAGGEYENFVRKSIPAWRPHGHFEDGKFEHSGYIAIALKAVDGVKVKRLLDDAVTPAENGLIAMLYTMPNKIDVYFISKVEPVPTTSREHEIAWKAVQDELNLYANIKIPISHETKTHSVRIPFAHDSGVWYYDTPEPITWETPQTLGEESAEVLDTWKARVQGAPTEEIESTDGEVETAEPDIVFPDEAYRGIFKLYREATSGKNEVCDEYNFGCLMTGMGSVFGRAAYIDATKIYPNFYTLLIGRSAIARKTTAQRQATDVIEAADPTLMVVNGIATAEGMISLLCSPTQEEMGTVESTDIIYDRINSTSPIRRDFDVCLEFRSKHRYSKKLKCRAARDWCND